MEGSNWLIVQSILGIRAQPADRIEIEFEIEIEIKIEIEIEIEIKIIMGRLFIETLSGPKIFKCRCCKVDTASHSEIVSKEFQGRYGRAYLFNNV